jgi:beta-phosphoglucomutase
MTPPHCAVLFDWDGTIADTNDIVIRAFQDVFIKNQVITSDESLQKLIGIGARNMIIETLKASHISYDDDKVDRILRGKIDAERKMTSEIRLFNGAVDVLYQVHCRVKTALATMKNRELIELQLDEKDLRQYFDAIISAEDAEAPKPDPRIFLQAAARLRCAPETCVVLEDSVFGIRAARAAGMHCIAVETGYYSARELRAERPDLVVTSIGEKEKILAFILGPNASGADTGW